MRVVVVAAGDLDPGDAALLAGAEMVVAADGGAASLERLGVVPHVLVGDLDSAGEPLREWASAAGARIESSPADKEETDSELAVETAVRAGADDIVLLGALGGTRVDHALANLLLLSDESLTGRQVALRHGATVVRCLRGGERMTLSGEPGEIVSLLPVGGDAHGIVTEGLRYPLRGESLRFGRARGISNVVTVAGAWVRLERGTLLVFEIGAGG